MKKKLFLGLEMLWLGHPHITLLLITSGNVAKAKTDENTFDTGVRTVCGHRWTDEKRIREEVERERYSVLLGMPVEQYLESFEHFRRRFILEARFYGDHFDEF